MGEQRVHQRAVEIAGGGMHHEPGRLVQDDQIRVLKQYGERDALRLRRCGRRGRDV